MHIKGIGINLGATQLDVLKNYLAGAESLGYDYAEISGCDANVVINGRLRRPRVERVKAVTRQFKLKYTVHGPNDLNLGFDDAPDVEERALAAYLEFASELESPILVYHSGLIFLHEPSWGLTPLPNEATMQRRRQREVEALQRLARRAQELGVTIAMENRDSHLWEVAALTRHGLPVEYLAKYHPGLLIPEVNRQIAAVGHPNLGMTLDFGHTYIASRSCGFDFLEAVSQAAPYVRHIHMHDNYGKLDRFAEDQGEKLPLGQADLHLPPGWGEIPLRQALQRLPDYQGLITLEIRARYSDDLGEALQAARELVAGA